MVLFERGGRLRGRKRAGRGQSRRRQEGKRKKSHQREEMELRTARGATFWRVNMTQSPTVMGMTPFWRVSMRKIQIVRNTTFQRVDLRVTMMTLDMKVVMVRKKGSSLSQGA
jgi:hypothetical protein